MRFALLPLGAAIFTTGCDGYQIVECTPEHQEYIDVGLAWTVDNSAVIDATMAAHWDKPRTPMEQILAALEDANIQCGIGNREHDGIAASHIDPGNRIVIDVEGSYFTDAYEQYARTCWTREYTFAQLYEKTVPIVDRTEHPSPLNESLECDASLGYMALLLLHEADHEVVGDHTEEAKEKAARIQDKYGPATDARFLRWVDATYAIGYWAVVAATNLWAEKRDTYFATLDATP